MDDNEKPGRSASEREDESLADSAAMPSTHEENSLEEYGGASDEDTISAAGSESEPSAQDDATEEEQRAEPEPRAQSQKKPRPAKIPQRSQKNGKPATHHDRQAPVREERRAITQAPAAHKAQQHISHTPNHKTKSTEHHSAKAYSSPNRQQTEREPMARKIIKKKDQSSKKSTAWIWIVIAIIIIAGAVYILTMKKAVQPPVLALVNGEPVFSSDIMDESAKLPANLRATLTPTQLLDQVIQEKLLLQEAKNQGIEVSASDVNDSFKDFLAQRGITAAQARDMLAAQNISGTFLYKLIHDQLVIGLLLNRTILSNITVNQSEEEQYYLAHPELYSTPKSARIRHILILVNDKRNDSDAKALAMQIASEVTVSNFCLYVENYSEDAVTRYSCGQLSYDNNTQLLPELKEAGFTIPIPHVGVVRTQLGYHVVEPIGQYNATKKLFIQVRSLMEQGVRLDKGKAAYQQYITYLEAQASIINYYADPTLAQPKLDPSLYTPKPESELPSVELPAPDTGVGSQAPLISPQTPSETNTSAPAPATTPATTPPAVSSMGPDNTSNTSASSPATGDVTSTPSTSSSASTPSTPAATPTAQNTSFNYSVNATQQTPEEIQKAKLDAFATCLSDKGVKMYGTYWCGYCNKQKELFGTSFDKVNYVECASADNPQEQTDVCLKAQVRTYPTWIIADNQYTGTQTLANLAQLSGCSPG